MARRNGEPLNLLLEIGAEEIPDWMLAGALEYLGGAVGDLLKQHQLGEAPSAPMPRRAAWWFAPKG
jgi:glycyl-tRNA synthetase beta subunit